MDQTPITFDELTMILGRKDVEIFALQRRVAELEKLLREMKEKQ